MLKVTIFILSLVFLTEIHRCDCVLAWLFGIEEGDKKTSSSEQQVPDDIITSEKVNSPFEMQTADEKFLSQSQFTKDLSVLDVCHHGVIAELTSTCSDLTEEELGKLAVQLLNCQSQAEGRQVFPCTREMTIAECTGDMDPVTWNAYQIVSNRARAVCYATRQNQFRMRTEFTVNQLVHTAQGQLSALNKLQEGHQNLEELTHSTYDKVQESHDKISDSQERLLMTNKHVNSYIVGNIRELTREKSLIASGNKQLAAMTEDLREKLDETKDRILEQGMNQRENHNEILEDLAAIRDKAKEVWSKIDAGSKDMLQYQDDAREHYRRTLINLQKINNTIQYLENTIHNTRAELENKLDWLLSIVGGTGDKVALLSTIFLHAVYLVLGALLSAFLQTPHFSRLLLLGLVPVNAWAQLHTRKSLGFLPMTMFIILTVAANWMVTWTWYVYTRYKYTKQCSPQLPSSRSKPHTDNANSTPGKTRSGSGMSTPDIHKLVHILENMYNSGMLHGSPSGVDRSHDVVETPRRPLAITAPATTAPTNTPYSPRVRDNSHLRKSMVKRHLADDLDDIPTSTPKRRNSPAPSLVSTPIHCDISTQDIKTLDTERAELTDDLDTSVVTPLPTDVDSYMVKPLPTTPNTSRRHSLAESEISTTSTTVSSRRSRKGRASLVPTPNKSVSRALCLATTKSGMPCKLQSVDGSAFCHKHQVTK